MSTHFVSQDSTVNQLNLPITEVFFIEIIEI
jgi:hypothetical protein